MKNSERIAAILEALDLIDVDALDVWIADGCPLFEGSVDSPHLIWDEGYRVKTGEDRERQRIAAAESRRRFEAGEMEPWEAMSYLTMRAYIVSALPKKK
jgi:hypothetical protein